MTTLLSIIIIVALSLLASLLPLPWFTPVIIAALVGVATPRIKANPFLAGGFGVMLFWLIKALSPFMNQKVLVQKVSDIFTEQLGFSVSPILFLFLTLVLGFLLGMFATSSLHYLTAPVKKVGNRLGSSRTSRHGGTYKLDLN